MGWFKFLTGKAPGEIEARGDRFFEAGEYGAAKLEYEKALDKFSRQSTGNPGLMEGLNEKVTRTREALALSHKETAQSLMETGYYDEAEERLRLALALTGENGFRREIELMLEAIGKAVSEAAKREFSDVYLEEKDRQEGLVETGEEEYFEALCSTLSDEERAAYYRYGDAFRRGFVALNQGDFESAVTEMSEALGENPEKGSYILLELASAHVNLGRQDAAQDLLEEFLEVRPNSLKAYAVLCEILWEKKAFDEALARLNSCPQAGVEPVAHLLLWGQTLLQAERFEEAETLFLGFLHSHGWEENVARSLARVYEAVGAKGKARNLYLEIMQNCQTCRRAVDPLIKRRLADISFESGEHTLETLEFYLALAQEDPDNRKEYYQRISRIYASLGNENEARRFRAFAEQEEQGRLR